MNNKIHVVFIIIVIALVFFYVTPQEYVYKTTGISYTDLNSTEVEQVKIEFNGIYQKRVFTNDTFYGYVYINGVPLSKYNLSFDSKDKANIIDYNRVKDNYEVRGAIYKNYNLSKFVIILNEENERQVITGPTDNLTEAKEIIITIMQSK